MLLIHADAPAFDHAVGRVTIEDAARVDVAATPIAATRINGVAHAPGVPGVVPFAMDCAAPPPGRAWRVRAQIDTDAGILFSDASIAADREPLAIRVAPSEGAGRWPEPIISR